jgi:hypothetical protein
VDRLEERLSADSEACLKREVMTRLFPKFIGHPHLEFKLEELKKAEGKTIQSVEFGEVEILAYIREMRSFAFHRWFFDGNLGRFKCIKPDTQIPWYAARGDKYRPNDLLGTIHSENKIDTF